MIERPPVTWNDIGGYEQVKQRLEMAVKWPMKYVSLWKHFHLVGTVFLFSTMKGILTMYSLESSSWNIITRSSRL